jgi:Mak10 subunit, NatC N(alpha)-terminal acetyltransferase
MDLGETYCIPQFSLFDSMSALELMDPKMDSGMIGGHESPIVPVPIRLKYRMYLSIPYDVGNVLIL